MDSYNNYRKKHLQPMKKWCVGMDMDRVSISDADVENGSPKEDEFWGVGDGEIMYKAYCYIIGNKILSDLLEREEA